MTNAPRCGGLGIGAGLEHGAPEAGRQGVFLDRHDPWSGFDPLDEARIEGFDEPGIDDADVEPFLGEESRRLEARSEEGPAGDDQAVAAAAHDFGGRGGDRRCSPRWWSTTAFG